MAAYFLLLYSGVSLIQDKRFFSSAPKENLAAIPARKTRFRGAHLLGWLLAILALLLFLGGFALAAWDGVRSSLRFWGFFVRFLAILYAMEIYDILFFDWVLLCHSNFFRIFTRNSRASSGRSSSAIIGAPICSILFCTYRSARPLRDSA